jgi:hypothetical protein
MKKGMLLMLILMTAVTLAGAAELTDKQKAELAGSGRWEHEVTTKGGGVNIVGHPSEKQSEQVESDYEQREQDYDSQLRRKAAQNEADARELESQIQQEDDKIREDRAYDEYLATEQYKARHFGEGFRSYDRRWGRRCN